MRGKITKRSVDALECEPGENRTILWDGDLRGFGVAAFPSGRKVYVVQYRQNGRSRRLHLGEHGRLTPDEARAEAKKNLGAAETGADPIAERSARRAVRTLKEVAEDSLRNAKRLKGRGSLSPRTAEEYRRLLVNHVYPTLGSTRMSDLTDTSVAKLLRKMDDKPVTANRALAVLSRVWSWAAEREQGRETRADANPVKGIKRNEEEGRERYLTTEELARLGDALREGEAVGFARGVRRSRFKRSAPLTPLKPSPRNILDRHAAAAIRLLILTGARLREILSLEWSQVDHARGVAFLPKSKTGKKTLYLSAAALAVLADIPRVAGCPYVIAGEKKGGMRADLKRPWASVLKAAGLKGVRIHDLRHSFASVGAGASMGLPIIGKLLGHTQAATTARYAHLDADPMRRAADAIGAAITAAMDGAPQGTDAENVVTIGGRRA